MKKSPYDNDFKRRSDDLKNWLTSRGHNTKLVTDQIEKFKHVEKNSMVFKWPNFVMYCMLERCYFKHQNNIYVDVILDKR